MSDIVLKQHNQPLKHFKNLRKVNYLTYANYIFKWRSFNSFENMLKTYLFNLILCVVDPQHLYNEYKPL